MNKRKRKKWLKQQGLYVNDSELWNFDCTICDWMIPRLKRFKEINIGYPGREPIDTPEKWDEALDKMIHSFELLRQDPLDLYEEEFDRDINGEFKKKCDQYQAETHEGLQLFADWFQSLWI